MCTLNSTDTKQHCKDFENSTMGKVTAQVPEWPLGGKQKVKIQTAIETELTLNPQLMEGC